jgi:NAD(P)-dependent dehydrogenase (short-subunit alcohol dehydrogenase family)
VTGLVEGRVCAVTGARRGIGRAHVEALLAEGARVVVNDVADPDVDGLGDDAVAHVGDVSTTGGADGLLRTALDTWGRLDVVVNNAGIARDRMLVNLSEEDWDDVLRVHLKSTFLVTQRAARHWRERSKAGDELDARVVNTVSSVGLYGNVGQANYAAAKGAIASFTLVAAMELERYGVTVNALCPTALTAMTEPVRLGDTPDAKAGAYDAFTNTP